MRSVGLSGQSGPLAHSHAEAVVLVSTCHDSVMVGLCDQVCLLNFVVIVLLCYS